MQQCATIDTDSQIYSKFLENLPQPHLELWYIMVDTGLRLSDALRLRRCDCIDGAVIVESKTKKLKTLHLHAPISWAGDKSWLFPSPRAGTDKPLSRSGVERIYKRAAAAAGIKGTVNAHTARKIYAQDIYQRSRSLAATQRALQHRYASTTLLYLYGSPKVTSSGEVINP